MNFIDLLIIYFSIGAPLGVYSYFQTGAESNQNKSVSKSIFTFFVWLPALVGLIKKRFSPENKSLPANKAQSSLADADEIKLYSVQKQLEKAFSLAETDYTIYEFRETLERYAGLTLALQNKSAEESSVALEFYETFENKNINLAAKCFDRRNRRRLFFHQSCARTDFLRLFADLFTAISAKTNRREFGELALEFVDLLRDSSAAGKIEQLIGKDFLDDTSFAVKSVETELWKPDIRREPLHARSTSTLLRVSTPTLQSRKKD